MIHLLRCPEVLYFKSFSRKTNVKNFISDIQIVDDVQKIIRLPSKSSSISLYPYYVSLILSQIQAI